MSRVFRSAPRQLRPRALEVRGTPTARSYHSRWKRMSAAYRRRNPFCVECERKGRLAFADVVDHKYPLAVGGPIHDLTNLWSLCHAHHNGLKAALERYARETGQTDRLVQWCDEPERGPYAGPTIRLLWRDP